MLLLIDGHKYNYEAEKICRIFFPDEHIKTLDAPCELTDEKTVVTRVRQTQAGFAVSVTASINGTVLEKNDEVLSDCDDCSNECERVMEVLIYKALSELTGTIPPWGILTGVRPSKLMHSLTLSLGEQGAQERFLQKLLVSEEKTRLACEVASRESRIIASSRDDSFSLYIAIPFCPSRCSYCSFVSHSITSDNAKKLVPQYVELLKHEIAYSARIARELSLRLESVYFGGGTPTVLTAQQLEQLLSAVNDNFDLSSCREYTVEAGRPDTITAEKLEALKRQGVTRISINPQTMSDEVLQKIGREHTAQQTLEAFALARKTGFDNINMDLIAGLDGDTAQSFARTLDIISSLSPESVTVHTLSLKRSSRKAYENSERERTGGASAEEPSSDSVQTVAQMLGDAQEKLTAQQYFPYYMYRQSRTAGNMENTGWCKNGFECVYNIFMMEECHTVLACGAGAVTKLREPSSGHIERIFNFKYPYEYIRRFDELMQRKERIKEFYLS